MNDPRPCRPRPAIVARRLLAVWAVLGAGGLAAAEFSIFNPFGEALAGTFAIPAEAGQVRLVRADTGAELPSQIVAEDGRNLLIGGLALPAHGTVTVRTEAVAPGTPTGLRCGEDATKTLRIESPLYRLVLDGKTGYQLTGLDDLVAKTTCRLVSGLDLIEDGEPEAYNGMGAKSRHRWLQREAQVAATVLYAGACEAAVRLEWSQAGSQAALTLRLNAFNRLVRHTAVLAPGPAIMQASFQVSVPGFSSAKGEATMLPQDERSPQRTVACPGHEFLWNPERRQGLGLIAPEGGNIRNAYWEMKGVREGGTSDTNILTIFGRPLRGLVEPAPQQLHFSLMAGGDPTEIAAYRLAAGRAREFTVLPATPLATLATAALPLAGRPLALRLAFVPQLAGSTVSLLAGAETLYAGPVTAGRQVECAWTPAGEGLVAIRALGPAGEMLVERIVEVRKEVEIRSLATSKIVFKPGELMRAAMELRSNAAQTGAVTIRSSVVSGIDQRAVVDEQRIALAPGEERRIDVAWAKDVRQGGATLLVEALVGGRVVDRAEECFALSPASIRVGQYSVCNPGWFNRPGQEEVTVRQLRNNYFTAFEYYAWTPCPFTGLTPEGDEWMPQTESQVAYTARIRKSFVTGFVRHAHDNGLQVFPWMNGEVALPTGLDHPEHYRYGASGQPLLYNGNIWDGKRYAIAYSASPYSEQGAYDWGRRMADSIDMFGWDGCRFDWAFTPWIVGDPMRAGESQWFDATGTGSHARFPDNDAAGTAFLKAFRRGVAERHPGFTYGTNSSDLNDNTWRLQPAYSTEISTGSWLWFESLLSYDRKETCTWGSWAERMVAQFRRSRPLGAQVGVGWMQPYPPGTVSAKLMPYAILFSGFKWIGPPDRHESLGESWICWRYALRFAEYFYGNDFTAVAPQRVGGDIQVQGDAGTLWKPWVFERTAGKTRDVVVGILNTEGGTHVCERRARPAPRTGLVVRLALAAGERLVSAALLAPEPTPHAMRLEIGADGQVALPPIDWAGAVVLHIEKE